MTFSSIVPVLLYRTPHLPFDLVAQKLVHYIADHDDTHMQTVTLGAVSTLRKLQWFNDGFPTVEVI